MSLRDVIIERVRQYGPLTVAEYMELALYHPELGYYARADRRSGREGDFYTSVDVGAIFGELLAVQFREMWRLLGARRPPFGVGEDRPASGAWFDLVEAGAGNGRLARDVLDAVAATDPDFYAAIRLHLVDRSPAAGATQPSTLGPHASTLAGSTPDLPDHVRGVIFANELLDALPTHVVVMRPEGLREVFVNVDESWLVEWEGPPSTPALEEYFERLGMRLETGWRAEVNLSAIQWVRAAARRLKEGFLVLIDYGHEARELYSAIHPDGTLTTYHEHIRDAVGGAMRPPDGSVGLCPPHPADGAGEATAARPRSRVPWLEEPGERDITAHVDFSSVRQAAEEEGLRVLGLLDQTYFLLGLGAAERLAAQPCDTVSSLKQRLAVKTLLLPGGLGSSHKVLVLGGDVGRPSLRGLSCRPRLT